MISQTQIGERLAAARHQLSLSTTQIEALARLPAQRLEGIERGENLTAGEIWRVSAALGIDPEQLLKEEPPPVERSTARFLSEGVLDAPDLRLLRIGAALGQIGGWLQEQLGVAEALPGAATPLVDLHPGREGYRLGAEARVALRVGGEPIPSVIDLLGGLGVHVGAVDFTTAGVVAASIREPGGMPIILLNRRSRRVLSARARRAALAHELCHLLHDLEPARTLTSITRLTAREDAQEQRANAFAPAFLAPPSALPTALDPTALAAVLVRRWWLSGEAAAWYTGNLLSLSSEEIHHLRPPRASVSPPEGALPADLTSGRIGQLAAIAQEEGIISAARLAEIRRMA